MNDIKLTSESLLPIAPGSSAGQLAACGRWHEVGRSDSLFPICMGERLCVELCLLHDSPIPQAPRFHIPIPAIVPLASCGPSGQQLGKMGLATTSGCHLMGPAAGQAQTGWGSKGHRAALLPPPSKGLTCWCQTNQESVWRERGLQPEGILSSSCRLALPH